MQAEDKPLPRIKLEDDRFITYFHLVRKKPGERPDEGMECDAVIAETVRKCNKVVEKIALLKLKDALKLGAEGAGSDGEAKRA